MTGMRPLPLKLTSPPGHLRPIHALGRVSWDVLLDDDRGYELFSCLSTSSYRGTNIRVSLTGS